jgi:glycosyl hydrolase family 18 (putative chitinase)
VVPPDANKVKHITHVALAFLNSGLFNGDPVRPGTRQWPLFANVPDIRAQFSSGTKVLVALGGWGDTSGFEVAAKDDESRSAWAKNVAVMVEDVGADGMSRGDNIRSRGLTVS